MSEVEFWSVSGSGRLDFTQRPEDLFSSLFCSKPFSSLKNWRWRKRCVFLFTSASDDNVSDACNDFFSKQQCWIYDFTIQFVSSLVYLKNLLKSKWQKILNLGDFTLTKPPNTFLFFLTSIALFSYAGDNCNSNKCKQ